MNSISRNKYIDKSATPLKAYFTLASVRERAQTTYARLRTYVLMYIRTRTRTNDGADVAVRGKKRRRRSESGKEREEREREPGVLIEEWFAPSIKNLVCFWPTDIEEKLFASGI